jgi:hypothetical protein
MTSIPQNHKTFHHNRTSSININSIKKIEFNIFSTFRRVSPSPRENINLKKINNMTLQKISSRSTFPTLPSQKDLTSLNKKMLLHIEGLKTKSSNIQSIQNLHEYSSTEVSSSKNFNLKLRKMVLNKLKNTKI